MAVVIKNLSICYFPVPKVANTSIKHLLYEVENGRGFFSAVKDENVRTKKNIHREYKTPRFSQICPEDYIDLIRFTVIRDPIERAMSAWRNRVVHHQELSLKHVPAASFEKMGIPANPDLNTFIQNLSSYRQVSASIEKHTDPMVTFLGRDPEFFNIIIPIRESYLVEELFHVLTGTKYSLRRSQTGGPTVSLKDLSRNNVDLLREFYQKDYQAFGKYLTSSGAAVRMHNVLEKISKPSKFHV